MKNGDSTNSASSISAIDERLHTIERLNIAQLIEAFKTEIQALKQANFQMKVYGGAAAIAILVLCGFSITTVPSSVANSVATDIATETATTVAQSTAEDVADEFARTTLPGLVDSELNSKKEVVEQIYALRDKAELAATRASGHESAAQNAANNATKAADAAHERLEFLRQSGLIKVGSVNMQSIGDVDAAQVDLEWKPGMQVFLSVESSGNSSDDQMPLVTWNRNDKGFRIVMRNAISTLRINRQNDTVNVQWLVIQPL